MNLFVSIKLDHERYANLGLNPYASDQKGTCHFQMILDVDTGPHIGRHVRSILYWPTDNFNPMYLLQEALSIINSDRAIMEGTVVDGVVSPDLERGLPGAVSEVREEAGG